MSDLQESGRIRGLFAVLAGTQRSAGKETLLLPVRDLWQGKRDLISVLGYSVLNLFFQAASLVLIFSYVAALESKQAIRFAGYEYTPTASAIELVVSGGLAASLIFLSALISLQARRVTVRAGLDYYRFCLKRAVSEVRNLAVRAPASFSRLPITAFRATLSGDVRYASAAYTQLISSVLPAITLFGAMILLFILEAGLGLITVISLLVFLPVYTVLFRRGQTLQEDLREAARENARDKNAILEMALQDAATIAPRDLNWLESWMNEGITTHYLGLLGRRQKLSDYAAVVANLGIALATAGISVNSSTRKATPYRS